MIKILFLSGALILTATLSLYIIGGADVSTTGTKYAARFIETESGVTTKCILNKKDHTFHCEESRENYSDTYYYRHWSDFIKERNNFGSTYYIKQVKRMGDETYTFHNRYDSRFRLVRNTSLMLETSWLSWDSRGRPLLGKYDYHHNCLNRDIRVIYDNTEKIIRMISSGGEEISPKGCTKLPVLLLFKFDDRGNLLIKSSAFDSGLITVQRYKIVEYATVCY
jgi:hypothetical protein